MVQLSHPYMTTGKTIALTRWTFIGKVMSLLFNMLSKLVMTSLVAQRLKRLPTMQETWVGKIPWRRKWQPTPVLLPEKSHGRKSLAGYSPWGRKELDTTERLHFTRLVITFLPRNKCLLISWLQSPSAVILEPQNIKSVTVSTVSPSISHEVMGPRCHDHHFLNV